MKKQFIYILSLCFIIGAGFISCNLEIKHPNGFTVYIGGNTNSRSVCNGHTMVTPDNAKEIVITISDGMNTDEVFKKTEKSLICTETSITVPSIKHTGEISISIKLVNELATYTGDVEIDLSNLPTPNVSIPIKEVIPHIVLFGNNKFYTVPEPKNTGLVYELNFTLGTSIVPGAFVTDKYGRLIYNNGSGFFIYGDESGSKILSNENASCVDLENNSFYCVINKAGKKVISKFDITGATLQNSSTNVSPEITGTVLALTVYKDYVFAVIKNGKTFIAVFNKNNLAKQFNSKEVSIPNTKDILVIDQFIYVIEKEKPTSGSETKGTLSKIFLGKVLTNGSGTVNVESAANTINFDTKPHLYGAIKFLGVRNNKVYIADAGNDGTSNHYRLGIYNPEKKTIEYINTSEYGSDINFN